MNDFDISTIDYKKCKKSTKKAHKKVVSLQEKVANIEEFIKLSDKNIFPLIIVINKKEFEAIQYNYLNKDFSENSYLIKLVENYYESALLSDNSPNIYLIFNIDRLVQAFYSDRIYIDKFITKNDRIRYVYNVYYSYMVGFPTIMGLVNERKLFTKNSCIDKIIPMELAKQIGLEYIKNERKKVVLTKEQIDEIHSRGNITPLEKVKEWEAIGLCAPGDAIGGAANRCGEFKHNCHNCLVDYANYKSEYHSTFDNLKIVHPATSIYAETSGPVLKKVKHPKNTTNE